MNVEASFRRDRHIQTTVLPCDTELSKISRLFNFNHVTSFVPLQCTPARGLNESLALAENALRLYNDSVTKDYGKIAEVIQR